ncbi:uncharacterized protein [Antedon mediterranea]|uniref:uncharacterized protein n=1 Tax=Antedon mediterranea TaxID=105859 RepID=UPI003AF44431
MVQKIASAVQHIKDRNFVKGIYNRARRTLPHGLTIEPTDTHVTRTGVWAQNIFSKGCVFGPYEGPDGIAIEEWKDFQESKTSEDLENQFNERMCNWMIFVNSGRNRKETNLEAVFYDGSIFFRTLRTIKKSEQLLVSRSDVEIVNSDCTNEEEALSQPVHVTTQNNDKRQLVNLSTATELKDSSEILGNDEELSFDLTEYLQQNQIELIEKSMNYEPRNRTEPVHYKGTCPPGKTVRGNEPYMCVQCGAQFAQRSALMKHENTHMEDLGRYRCTYCGRVFIQKGSLQKHEEMHTNNQKLAICKVCSVCFEGQSDLAEHFKMFHSSEVGRAFPCFICGTGFTKLGSLRAHHRLKHGGKYLQNCRFCMKEFRSKSYLDTHEYQHLSDKPFACQFCSFKFQSRSKLMKHIKGRHKEIIESTAASERESLVCYYCGYTFSVHSQFIKHVKLCKIGLPKDYESSICPASTEKYKCLECFLPLQSSNALQRHMEQEHTDRPHKCSECFQSFRLRCHLKNHMMSHKRYPHSCSTCKKSFRDSSVLKHHKCMLNSYKEKPTLICPVCHRGFYGRSQHTRHVTLCKMGTYNKSMIYRMKKQPVYCQFCKVCFSSHKELFAHEQSCDGTKNSNDERKSSYYGCGLCGKDFVSCSLLKGHLNSSHPVENEESKLRKLKLNVCLACKRSFVCLKGLSRHVNHCPALGRAVVFTVTSNTKMYGCSICSQKFKTYTLFRSHRIKCKGRKNSGNPIDVNVMQNFNKNPGSSENTKLSSENKTNENIDESKEETIAQPALKFKCNKCGKRFHTLRGLGNHKVYCRKRSVFHKLKNNTPGPLKCAECFRVFAKRSTLIAHKMVCTVQRRKALSEDGIKPTARKGKIFNCSGCRRSFTRLKGIRMHQRFCMPDITSEPESSEFSNPQSDGSGYSCKICGKTFKKMKGLHAHGLTCMPNIAGDRYPPIGSGPSTSKKKYGCKYCSMRFDKHYYLGSHVRNCAGRARKKKQAIAKVDTSKTESDKMDVHKSEMTDDLFICRKCGTSFDNEEKLVEHDYVCCPEFQLKVFSGEKSGTTFAEESDVVKHKEEDHDRKKHFQCGVCGKTFLRNSGLGKHRITCVKKPKTFHKDVIRKMQSTSNKIKKRLICQTCGNSFSSLATLKKHSRLNRCKIVHNCTLCGFNFQSISEFDEHTQRCQQIRQHICNICGRGFRVAGFLKRHTLSAHASKPTGKDRKSSDKITVTEEPDVQNVKSDIATSPSNLKVESSADQVLDNSSYSCGRCYKEFSTLEEFAEHEEIEHLKPNECSHCSLRFKTQRELLLHRKQHPDKYPHKCKICPMRYLFSAHLRRHFVRKHTRKGNPQ